MFFRPGGRVVAVAAIAVATLATARPVAAASATLKVDPATQTVAQGSTFTVHVIEQSSVVVAGAQASLTFDKTKLQIQSVAKGSPFAGAQLWVPSNGPNDAVASANASGKLAQVAALFISPPGVAAGAQDFIDVTFKATGCGQVALGLPLGNLDGQITDGSNTDNWGGSTVPVSASGGSVTIDSCSGDAGSSDQATQGDTSQTAGQTQGAQAASGDNAAGQTQSPGCGGAAGGAPANPTGDAGNGGAGNAATPSGPAGPANNNLPLWLPIVFAIPAFAVVWLGLRKWRLGETG